MKIMREWRCTKVSPGSLSPVGIVDPENPDDSDSSVDDTDSDEEPPPHTKARDTSGRNPATPGHPTPVTHRTPDQATRI